MRKLAGEKLKRILYFLLGILLIVIGMIGLALPVFPTLPFLFLALVCFMKVSKRFKGYVKKNRLYIKYLAKYEKNGKLPVKLLIASAIIFLLFAAAALIILSVLYCYIQK
ncbi:MAG: YbaN family protein, partial [Clostridiales bacterium]|nr:YbaN family protein [Clostridiales bacterium]